MSLLALCWLADEHQILYNIFLFVWSKQYSHKCWDLNQDFPLRRLCWANECSFSRGRYCIAFSCIRTLFCRHIKQIDLRRLLLQLDSAIVNYLFRFCFLQLQLSLSKVWRSMYVGVQRLGRTMLPSLFVKKMHITTLGVLKSNLCSHLDKVTGANCYDKCIMLC